MYSDFLGVRVREYVWDCANLSLQSMRVLLHVHSKSQKTPPNGCWKRRLKQLSGLWLRKTGSNFDDFLEEEGLRTAIRCCGEATLPSSCGRKCRQSIQQSRNGNGCYRSALDRLLDPDNSSGRDRLQSLALGARLRMELEFRQCRMLANNQSLNIVTWLSVTGLASQVPRQPLGAS